MDFDPERYVADARIDAAATERARARSVRDQLSADLTITAILIDVVERGGSIRIDLPGGERCEGVATGVGGDVVTVIDRQERLKLVALAHVCAVHATPGAYLGIESRRVEPRAHQRDSVADGWSFGDPEHDGPERDPWDAPLWGTQMWDREPESTSLLDLLRELAEDRASVAISTTATTSSRGQPQGPGQALGDGPGDPAARPTGDLLAANDDLVLLRAGHRERRGQAELEAAMPAPTVAIALSQITMVTVLAQ